MKTTKIKSPMSVLLSISDSEFSVEIEEYLNKKHLKNGIIFSGKGTSESNIADIFGFGMDERTILAVLVPEEKKEKYLEDITEITRIESDNYGLAMLLDVSSASSPLLGLMGIEV